MEMDRVEARHLQNKRKTPLWGRIRNSYIFLGIFLCLGFIAFFPVKICAETQKTVRVGYYYSHNFQEGMGDEEVKSGYSYEYLQKLASYTGWKYEYVYGEWQELFEKLVSGDIDLMAGVAYSSDRVQKISYPDSEMLNETFYIYKNDTDDSMKCGDIDSYKGKKIGTLKNNQRMTVALEKWKRRNDAQIEIVYYDSLEECAGDFNDKKIDGFVSADNVVSSYSGISPVEKIGKQPFYICVAKKRPDILSELNMAVTIINEQDLNDLDDLKNKYYTETTVSVFMSEQEQAWIKEHPKIVVGYLNHYLPYCDTAKDGGVTGLISDMIPDMFHALPGGYDPEITYRCFEDQQDMLESLKKKEIDIAFPVSDGQWYSEQNGFVQSSSVVAFPISLAYREPYNDHITDRIAVNENNLRQYWYTISNYPDAEIVMYDTIEECLDAVRDEEVDCTLLGALRVSQLMRGDRKLNVITLPNEEKICFAIAQGNSATLQIVNHAISILGDSYGLNHTYRYLDSLYDYTLTDVVQDHVWLFAGIMVLVLVLIIWYFIRREQAQRVAARREQKHKELLEEALRAARQASVAKKVFLQNMSHDIRTPMNAVVGFTNLAIQAGDDTEKVRDYLSKIQVSGNHLLGIVNEVLEISRIESGQTKLDETVCSLSDIVQETNVIIGNQALARKQEFTIDISGVQNEFVYCDKLRMKEILVNLLSNSVKYTRVGGNISLSIIQRTCQKEGYGSYEFCVKDNGCGMSEEFQKKVFLPFERQATSTVSGVQGTGLGMTIIKGFVDLMGGTIALRSEENKGTEITVNLCLKLAEAPEKKEPPMPSYPEEYFQGKRLLLAEDNALNREIAVAILEEMGLEVEIAENGEIAVQKVGKAQAGYYAAVLMDIQMPVMDGYTATRKIRKLGDKRLASIPIIAVSANAFDEDREASQAAGMNGHLAKPIIPAELLKTLSEVLAEAEK